jgi:hypothetical protein
MAWPVAGSQIRTSLSMPPVARRLPSGDLPLLGWRGGARALVNSQPASHNRAAAAAPPPPTHPLAHFVVVVVVKRPSHLHRACVARRWMGRREKERVPGCAQDPIGVPGERRQWRLGENVPEAERCITATSGQLATVWAEGGHQHGFRVSCSHRPIHPPTAAQDAMTACEQRGSQAAPHGGAI